MTLEELRNHGLIWAINRYIFHPRGMALAVNFDTDKIEKTAFETDVKISGWSILVDAEECPWGYETTLDADAYRRFEEFVERIKDVREMWVSAGGEGILNIPGDLPKLAALVDAQEE